MYLSHISHACFSKCSFYLIIKCLLRCGMGLNVTIECPLLDHQVKRDVIILDVTCSDVTVEHSLFIIRPTFAFPPK